MGDLAEDHIGGGGPLEGAGGFIVGFEVIGDGGAKLRDAEEAGALQAATSQFGEEAFDLIGPRAAGGDKVKVPAKVAGDQRTTASVLWVA